MRHIVLPALLLVTSFACSSSTSSGVAPPNADSASTEPEESANEEDDPTSSDAGTGVRDAGRARDAGSRPPKPDASTPKDGGSVGDGATVDSAPPFASIVGRCEAKDPNDFFAGYVYNGPSQSNLSVSTCYCNGAVLPVAASGFGAGSSVPIDLIACTTCDMTAAGSTCRGPRTIAPVSTASAPACNGAGRLDGSIGGTSAPPIKTAVAGYRNTEGISVYLYEDDDTITTWPEPATQGDRRVRLYVGDVTAPSRIWSELGIYEYDGAAWALVETANLVVAHVTTIDRTGASPQADCYGRIAGTVTASLSSGWLVGAFDAPLLGPAF